MVEFIGPLTVKKEANVSWFGGGNWEVLWRHWMLLSCNTVLPSYGGANVGGNARVI